MTSRWKQWPETRLSDSTVACGHSCRKRRRLNLARYGHRVRGWTRCSASMKTSCRPYAISLSQTNVGEPLHWRQPLVRVILEKALQRSSHPPTFGTLRDSCTLGSYDLAPPTGLHLVARALM